MKKITFLALFLMTFSFSNAQFTSGEVVLTSNTNNNMNVTIETTATDVTLTLMGSDNKWFAVGFGGIDMATVSDVFVYDGTGNFDKVGHNQTNPTDDTNQDWTIISNTVDGIYRTIQATRTLSTSDSHDYTFVNDTSNIDVIWAYGNSLTLGNHAARYWTTITRTAVANINKEKQIQFAMYPNPAKTNLNIVLPSNLENVQVEIYDILGKKVLQKKSQTAFNTLDVTNIKAGVYLIKIIEERTVIGVKQFIKK